MGSVQMLSCLCRDVPSLKAEYGCDVFVETGCYRGNSMSYVVQLGFREVWSCDIEPANVAHCLETFGRPGLNIEVGLSVDFLERLLPRLDGVPSVMFWLDAHLPDDRKGHAVDLPLEQELDIINRIRPGRPDVVLIDDLRIYEDGPFTGGPWDRSGYENLSLSFLDRHGYNVERFYGEEGYLVLTRPACRTSS